jgi:TPR repeat protein
MEKLVTIAVFLAAIALQSMAYAAGDYVWEERFQKELPKAEQGDVKAQYAVGEMYEKGKGAVRNLQMAFTWYLKAAEQGDVKAAYKVGYCYLKGKGVGKDYEEALTWLKKASNKDYVRAYYYLGDMYEHGYGVLKDYDEALKWYKRALKGGYGNAADRMQRIARAQSQQEDERRAEAKARAEREKARARVAAARSASKRSEPPPKAPATPKERVLAGGWKKRTRAVEYLPSNVTKCEDKGVRIECLSREMQRNIGMADIDYTTKAIIFAFKPNGTFKVSYRNNVLKVTVTDPEFEESGGKVPVQVGWQDAEHKLVCQLDGDDRMTCTKNKLRKIKLHRE